jgi:hypothetical protein
VGGLIGLLVLFVPPLVVLWLANQADARAPATLAQAAAGVTGQVTPLGLAAASGATPSPSPAGWPDGERTPAEQHGMAGERWPELQGLPQTQAPGGEGSLFAFLTYAPIVLLYLPLVAAGLFIELVGPLASGAHQAQALQDMGMAGIGNQQAATMLQQLGAGLWIPSLVGMLLLLRPTRRLLARIIPIDPRRTVHAVAVSFTMLIVINLLMTTIFLPMVTRDLQAQSANGTPAITVSMLWGQDILLFVIGIVGVGWLSRRNLGQALQRLGICVPSLRQVAVGVGGGLVLIPLSVGIQFAAGALHVPQDATVQKLTQLLVGPLTQSVLGVVTLGVAAALGEETVFRGALQPRFGLVLTAIMFALLHQQYSFSLSTLVVLILGLVLGFIRDRTNTSTSMIVHAVFNSTQGLLALLNVIK